MNQNNKTINQMRAITISREYGSGGGEIATRLARHLQWQLLDHEIVERVAIEMGTSLIAAEAYDERTEGILARTFKNLQSLQPSYMVGASSQAFLRNEETYLKTISQIVNAAVAQGHVIIVGRGSQMLLAQQRDVLHVRIIAPLEKRIDYVMKREGIGRTVAQSRIKMKDNDRTKQLEIVYRRKPDDAHLYDIVLSTAFLDLDSAVEIISLALQRKAKQLSAKADELGPSVGLSPYPEKPADFHPKVG
jgi:cytidylate kinase